MTFTSNTTSNGSRICLEIILPEDDVYEEDERFIISITSVSPPTVAIIGSQSGFTIKLEDNGGCYAKAGLKKLKLLSLTIILQTPRWHS